MEILIVEDYPQLASVLARMLRRQGHTCVTALTVAETLAEVEALGQRHFDCAIVDIDLPDGDGVSLAERLVARRSVGEIIFFTATIDATVLARAARLGSVIGKVAGVRLLLQAIERRASTKRAKEPLLVPQLDPFTIPTSALGPLSVYGQEHLS